MQSPSQLITTHADDLKAQEAEAGTWWRRALIGGTGLILIAAIGGATGLNDIVVSLAFILGAGTIFFFMRKRDEAQDLAAERLEFDRPELYGLLGQQDEEVDEQNERLRHLSREIVSLKRMRMVRNRARYSEVTGILIGSIAVTFLVWFGFSLEDFLSIYHGDTDHSEDYIEAYEAEVVSIGLVGLVLFGWAITRFRSARSARREHDRLELEHDVIPVEAKADISRARKLLLTNQRNLSSYYAINRFNSRVTIAVAILCVVAGIGITVWTIQAIIGTNVTEEGSKLMVAAVGAANAIMINVVAAIVLRIQATISSNVNAFHDRLVRSHDIFLANVIAAEIDDDVVRRETLASISKAIGLRGTSSNAGKSSNGADKPKK
ncbi:hypothetical protein [Tropicimonas sp. S265A]|uniref:hypothetical protein n=1 Tax=Tropicimonas sp. S265A TaxID=3415134 RepID=UPI003C7BABE7